MCEAKKTIDATCSLHVECLSSQGLECSANRCQCSVNKYLNHNKIISLYTLNDNFFRSYFNIENSMCEKLKEYGEACVQENECSTSSSLICSENTCQCISSR